MDRLTNNLVTTEDIFECYDPDRITGKGNLKKIYKCQDKRSLAKKIFMAFIKMLLDDMYEGGKLFVFPLPKHLYFALRFRNIPDDHFKAARKVGAYQEVDLYTTNFKCWELAANYNLKGKRIEESVKTSKNYRNRMIEKINNGYKYC